MRWPADQASADKPKRLHRMTPCTICAHPERAPIDAALTVGEPSLRTLEATYNVSRSALSRHSKEHTSMSQPHDYTHAPAETLTATPDFAELMHLAEGLVAQGEYASNQQISPPTKLQTFFFGIVITRIWVDPKHDVHLVARDFHPLDQRPDEVALARPVSRLQPVVEFGGEVLQAANNQLQFPVQGGLVRQRLALLLQAGQTLAQAGNPGLKLRLVNEALRITVDQPGHALAPLADLVFDGSQRCPFGARLGLQATS